MDLLLVNKNIILGGHMKNIFTNRKKLLKKNICVLALASALSATSAYADCDSCQELSTISNNTAAIANNTSFLGEMASSIQGIILTTTNALFGQLPDIANTTAQYAAIPSVQDAAFEDQRALLSEIETTFKGSVNDGETAEDAYKNIFDNYLIDDGAPSFNSANASAASLFLNPSKADYYNEESGQKAAAEKYIQLLSGAALASQRAPDKSWLKNSDNKNKKFTRAMVSQYYTFNATQSLIADNLAYVYGMNTGHDMNGSLDDYSGSTISESGLLKYIQLNKVENEDWYTQLGTMAISAIMQEQTILMAGAFLELTRIEGLLRRQLVTESASASTSLIMARALAQEIGKMNKPK